MTDRFQFADKLRHYVTRSAYTPGQLATLSDLPRTTIVNWLNGRVTSPRDWQPIVQLLAVLHLDEDEADEILQAAKKPTIAELRKIGQEGDQILLAGWERPSSQPTPPSHTPFQAIADLPYFVGRETILSDLKERLLNSEESAICVLQGMAGTGKTALAARTAYELRPHFPDGVLWARLDTSDTMTILHTFARAYGTDVSQYADTASRSRIVRDLLANKQALIILDNAMNSVSVDPLLPPTGQCAVLITTRRHDLRIAHGVNRITLRPFRPDGQVSRQLFTHFLGKEQVEANAQALAEIADYVGHLPLALAIVAARLAYEPGWTASDFLSRLQRTARHLKELQSEDQNVRLSFDASYELAPEEVQCFFATLSRFGGNDFTPEVAAAAANIGLVEAQDYLRVLYRLSLVQSGQDGRYQLHPLLRDYAQEQLPERSPWSPLANYYLDFLNRLRSGDSELMLESDNIMAAITGARENGESAVATKLLLAFTPYLKIQGRHEVAHQQLSQALITASKDQQLSILLFLSQIDRYFRRYNEAEAHLKAAVPLARQSNDIYFLSAIETEKGIIADCRGDFKSAYDYFQKALPLARQHGRADILIPLLKEIGVVEVQFRNYDGAEVYYQEALSIAQEKASIYSPMLLRCLGSIAIIRDQDFERAGNFYEDALQQARAINNREDMIPLLNNLAVTASQNGQMGVARTRLQEGLTLARSLFNQGGLGMILTNLGLLAMREQDWNTAEKYLLEAQRVASGGQLRPIEREVARILTLLSENQRGSNHIERLKIIFD